MNTGHERLKIKDGRHLTVETHTTVTEHPLHWHSFFEIEIILDGKGEYVINDIPYDMREYNVFFLNSTDFHYIRVDGKATMINISFDEESLDEKDMRLLLHRDRKRAYSLEREEHERITSAAELLRHEYESDGDCQRQLLQYILRSMLRKDPVEASLLVWEHGNGIKKAIAYMEIHFKERVSLTEIASEAGYHPTYFSELFKKVTGETYIETLTKLRIGCARTLLASGFSVSEACFLSGFGSSSGFFSAFKRLCHMSPTQYRTKHQSGKT